MASGKLTPRTIFLNFFIGQAVVVRRDLGFVVLHYLFMGLLAQDFVEDRRLRFSTAATRLEFEINEALRRERKRTPLLAR